MRIQSFKRLFKNDFAKEYQPIIDGLAGVVNDAFDSLYALSNRGISLKDNIACQVKDIEVIVDSNGIPVKTCSFIMDNATVKPIGLIPLQVNNLTNPSVYPTAGIWLTFTQNNNNILINHIAGLPANNTFRISVVLFY